MGSWEAVESFRAGENSMRGVLQYEPLSLRHANDLSALGAAVRSTAFTRNLELPSGFAELASYGALSLDVIEVLLPLNDVVESMVSLQAPCEGFESRLRPIAHVLRRILISDPSSFELQVSCALVAFVVQLCQLCNAIAPGRPSASHSPLSISTFPLGKIAQAFINQKNHYEGPAQRKALIWSCVVFANLLLDQEEQSLKARGHIIFISLTALLEEAREEQSWDILDPILRRFFCHGTLAASCKRTFEASIRRQKRWEDRGNLAPGVPHGAGPESLVESFVLREARDTLPIIDDD